LYAELPNGRKQACDLPVSINMYLTLTVVVVTMANNAIHSPTVLAVKMP